MGVFENIINSYANESITTNTIISVLVMVMRGYILNLNMALNKKRGKSQFSFGFI